MQTTEKPGLLLLRLHFMSWQNILHCVFFDQFKYVFVTNVQRITILATLMYDLLFIIHVHIQTFNLLQYSNFPERVINHCYTIYTHEPKDVYNSLQTIK